MTPSPFLPVLHGDTQPAHRTPAELALTALAGSWETQKGANAKQNGLHWNLGESVHISHTNPMLR